MNNVLSGLVIGACLVAGGWSVLLAMRNRLINDPLLIALAVAEILTLAQLVVAVVLVAGGQHPDGTATFLAYAVGELVILPVGTFWSIAEKSRSSTLVITIACLAVAVMTARMFQIWSSVGG